MIIDEDDSIARRDAPPQVDGIGSMPNERLGDPRVLEALAYIDANYHLDLTPEDAARQVQLSASRLHALFRLHAGTTPHRAIIKSKIEKASELFRATDLPPKQVLARVGMPDESHFYRKFKKEFNLTPTKYRESFRVRPTTQMRADE